MTFSHTSYGLIVTVLCSAVTRQIIYCGKEVQCYFNILFANVINIKYAGTRGIFWSIIDNTLRVHKHIPV